MTALTPEVLEAAFLNAPIGAYILTPTAEPVVLAVNDIFLRNTQRTREEMVGRSLFDVFPANPDDPSDVGEDSLRASILKAVETREPQTMPAQRYPIQRPLPGGGWVFEERYWNAVNTPILGTDGSVRCVLHTTQDVTAQVVAERALRDSERSARLAADVAEAERIRLRAVLDAVPVGIVMSDMAGRIIDSNHAHRHLWGEHSPAPDGVEDFARWKGWWADGSEHQGQPLTATEWPTARVLAGQPVLHDLIEIEPFGMPRLRRIVLMTGAPVTSSTGDIVGAVVAQLDVSDRVRAEQALRDADRRKDEFLAMLAHELRNPLAPVGAAADLLASGALDPSKVQQASEIIRRQVRHMTGLVDDLLDVSRVTRGKIELEQERVDMKRVVAEALEQTRPLIEEAAHRVATHLPAEPALVCGDDKRLVQILANLLTNAAKYTPEGGDIMVTLSACDRWVEVEVVDTGIGMAPDLVEHVFELFVQAHRTVDRAQGGLGIGLALVRRLVTLHGGTIRAASDGPGKGSRFTLCLPRLTNAASESRSNDTRGLVTTRSGLNVLVVDDNRDAAAMLAMLVEVAGHRVAIEHSPHKALERAAGEHFDVFLLDIGLPEMDGAELARCLRAMPAARSATLVAVSGYGQQRDRALAATAGFDAYFVKPVDSEKLTSLLRNLATGHGFD